MTDKIDLAEYLKTHDKSDFESLFEDARDIYEIRLENTEVPGSTIQKIKKIKEFIKNELSGLDEISKESYIKNDVREHFGLGKSEINKIYKQLSEDKTKDHGIHSEYFDDSGKLLVKKLSEYVRSRNSFITFKDTMEVYYYNCGVYVPNGEKIISIDVQNALGDYSRERHISEVINHVQLETMVDRSYINDGNKHINLLNGLFNIETFELEEHTDEFISIVQLPVKYDADADCPNIRKFLSDVVQIQDIPVMLEFIGYSMIPDTSIQRSMMLMGKGANGKSKTLSLIGRFIGHDNCSRESLHMLENDPYSIAELYGKLLNIFPDLASSALYENEIFKQLTGDEERIRARRIYQPPFSFKNTTKLIFSANDLPPVPGDDYAYFRRWILLEFVNRFEGESKDDKILDKITTEEELSGLFNLVVPALKQLIQNGEFSYYRTVQDIRKMYRINSDPIAAFADECIVYSEDDCLKSVVYNQYCNWCNDNGIDKKSEAEFAKRFKKIGFNPYKESKYPRRPIWQNCSIKVTIDEKLQCRPGSQNHPGRLKPLLTDPSVRASDLYDTLYHCFKKLFLDNDENGKNISIHVNNGSKSGCARTSPSTDSEKRRPGCFESPDGFTQLVKNVEEFCKLWESKHKKSINSIDVIGISMDYCSKYHFDSIEEVISIVRKYAKITTE